MKAKKSKIEVLFKTIFLIKDPSKDEVKSFLEQTIEGLKVKSIEVHPGKSSYKALVSSNLITLLTGQESFDDTTAGAERTKSFFVSNSSSLMREAPVSLKEKESGEMGALVSKLRKELSDAKNKEAELRSSIELFQEQLNSTSAKIEELDCEKERLEGDKKLLKDEIERLTARLEARARANISEGTSDSDLSKELAALEDILETKTKEYEEDKRTLQDQLGLMSLKILAERDRSDQFIKKAEIAEALEQSIAPLEAENKSLKETLEAKNGEFAEKEKLLQENTKELEKLKNESKDQLKKIGKLESLIRKSEIKAASATERLKVEEKAKEDIAKQQEELKKKVTDLETLNAKLQSKLLPEQQQTANNTIETSKQIEKLENELKAIEELNTSLKNKLAEAERAQEELKKQLNSGGIPNAKAPETNEQENQKIEDKKEQKGAIKEEESILQQKQKSNDVELIDMRNELVATKEELSGVKTELNKVKIELEKTKEELEKAHSANNKQVDNSKEESKEISDNGIGNIEQAARRIAELEALNKKLQKAAEDNESYAETIESLQKQRELMIKENADLKVSLYEAEANKKNNENNENTNTRKVSIIEDIKQCISDVIYAYKTMNTNAKQSKKIYADKKEQVEDFLAIVEGLATLKKDDEQMTIIKNLKEDTEFLKGFPDEPDQLKIILSCLKVMAGKKQNKLEQYKDEIEKHKTMIQVATAKITEYEEKLGFYC